MEGGVVDEFGGVRIAVGVWVWAVGVLGWREDGGGEIDGEGGESCAEMGVVGDGTGVGGECY